MRTIHFFFRSESGNIALLFGACVILIFFVAGFAVDYSLLINKQVRIQNVLDAATLAAGRAIRSGEISDRRSGGKSEINAYLQAVSDANVEANGLEAARFEIYDVNLDLETQTVSASAAYKQKLAFFSMFVDGDTQFVRAHSSAYFGASRVEVAFALDVTTSMSGSRIESLKQAVSSALEIVTGAEFLGLPAVRASIIPYSQAVNVGPDLARYVYPDYGLEKSSAPPFDQRLYEQTGVGYDVAEFRATADGKMVANPDGSAVDNCATDRKKPWDGVSFQYTDKDPTRGMMPRDSRLDTIVCTMPPVTLLTADKVTLKEAVRNLTTDGKTAGHIGLHWAWISISENWARYLPATSTPWPSVSDVNKYIVLMTDGRFNIAYADIGAAQYTNDNLMAQKHAINLCNVVKDSDITVFTVGYVIEADQSAAETLKTCASEDRYGRKYYYAAGNSAELDAAFKAIANTILDLRLSK